MKSSLGFSHCLISFLFGEQSEPLSVSVSQDAIGQRLRALLKLVLCVVSLFICREMDA